MTNHFVSALDGILNAEEKYCRDSLAEANQQDQEALSFGRGILRAIALVRPITSANQLADYYDRAGALVSQWRSIAAKSSEKKDTYTFLWMLGILTELAVIVAKTSMISDNKKR